MSSSKLSINHFQDFKQIGHGAFGKVYQATFKSTGKSVALKKISKKQIKSNNMMTQIGNQIQISKKLQHQNIIKLYDYFDDQNDIFLVLQLASGGQLYTKLMKKTRFDQSQTQKMIRQMISAVKYLHKNKIIHRDIKPQNILLDRKGNIKLADFGWSNFSGGDKPRKTYCGTVDYLAPEMIDKSGHDQSLDIWCLGVLVYQLLTGKTPFVSENAKGPEKRKIIQQNILSMDINFPNDFPTLAKGFVLGMIKRNPKQRLTLEQIENHEWLKQRVNQKSQQLPIMLKKPAKQYINMQAGPNHAQQLLILQKKNQFLQQQVTLLKINSQVSKQAPKQAQNQTSNLLKQIRRLKPLQQKLTTLQKDNDELWQNINKKDRQIIMLKSQVKKIQDLNQEIQKIKNDKRKVQDKYKKLQKQLNQTKTREIDLKEQLNQLSSNVSTKIKTGVKLTLTDITNPQFAQYIQQELQHLGSKFDQSKKVLLKVLQKQRISKEKQQQLGKLKAQQKEIKEIIKSQLKEEFQNQKDQILMTARKQLFQERQKWMTEREKFTKIYDQDQATNNNDNFKGLNKHQDLQLELQTIKQLNSYYQKTINEQNFRIKDFQNELKRKK